MDSPSSTGWCCRCEGCCALGLETLRRLVSSIDIIPTAADADAVPEATLTSLSVALAPTDGEGDAAVVADDCTAGAAVAVPSEELTRLGEKMLLRLPTTIKAPANRRKSSPQITPPMPLATHPDTNSMAVDHNIPCWERNLGPTISTMLVHFIARAPLPSDKHKHGRKEEFHIR